MLDVFTVDARHRCVPYWASHGEITLLMMRPGMEDLSNIVRVRILTLSLSWHILWLPPDRPANEAMQWIHDGARRRGCPR